MRIIRFLLDGSTSDQWLGIALHAVLFLTTMFVFNILRKLLGWADEAPRKRRAVSFSPEKEYVNPKKHKCNYNIVNVEDDPVEIEEDSDSDVEALSQSKYPPTTSSTPRLNGTRNSTDRSYRFCSSRNYTTPFKTPSSCCKKSKMGYFERNSKKIQNIGSDHRCPTLSKTHRLKEKNQYEELLQNFLPRRIHIIRDRPAERRAEAIEVIDLEKSNPSNTPSKPRQSPKVHDISRPQWCTSAAKKVEKEPVITIDDDAKKRDNKKDGAPHSTDDKVEKSPQAAKGEASPEKPGSSKHIECVATNSLRDQLAAKAVTRENFIPEVVKRYSDRVEQR